MILIKKKTFIPVFYNQRLKLKVEVYITLQKKIGKNVLHFLPLLECMCSRQVLWEQKNYSPLFLSCRSYSSSKRLRFKHFSDWIHLNIRCSLFSYFSKIEWRLCFDLLAKFSSTNKEIFQSSENSFIKWTWNIFLKGHFNYRNFEINLMCRGNKYITNLIFISYIFNFYQKRP